MSQTTALRPRTGTELIDAAVQLLRGHYAEFLGATALVYLPVLVLRLVLPLQVEPFVNLLSGLFGSVLTGAVVLITSDAYLGNPISPTATVRHALTRFGSLFGAGFVQGVLVGFGLLLLVVPGFVVFAWSFAMPMIVVLEGATANESFTRSRALARGSVPRILGILVVTGLICGVIWMVLAMILGAFFARNERAISVVAELIGVRTEVAATV
jgi:hypothetical protein